MTRPGRHRADDQTVRHDQHPDRIGAHLPNPTDREQRDVRELLDRLRGAGR